MEELPRRERDYTVAAAYLEEMEIVKVPPEVDLKDILSALRDVMSRADMFTHHHIQQEPLSVRERTNFDHPDSLENTLLAQHVADLLRGATIQRPVYDFATHTRTPETRSVEARPVILCEGRRSDPLGPAADPPAPPKAARTACEPRPHRGRVRGAAR